MGEPLTLYAVAEADDVAVAAVRGRDQAGLQRYRHGGRILRDGHDAVNGIVCVVVAHDADDDAVQLRRMVEDVDTAELPPAVMVNGVSVIGLGASLARGASM